jgi:hypothetical protein
MNLKQFKAHINKGDNILMLSFTKDGQDIQVEKMKKMRTVSYKDTTGFYLRTPSEDGRGSFCEWPKASDLTVDGAIFTIQDSFGVRTYQIIN